MKVKEIMAREIVYLHPQDELRRAYQLMLDNQCRHIPVLEDKVLVGMLSDRDILRNATLNEDGTLDVPTLALKDVMTTSLKTCPPKATISQIAEHMLSYGIDAVPILKEDKLVGLITSTDIIEYTASTDDGDDFPIEFDIYSLGEYEMMREENQK